MQGEDRSKAELLSEIADLQRQLAELKASDLNQAEQQAIQERIHQQERMAAVGQLAAGIAHDFNNILTSIIGFADLLRIRQDIPTSAVKNLDYIVQQGQRAAQLIDQILDFSRQSVPKKQEMSLVPFLTEVTKLLKRTIPENIDITLEIEPGCRHYIIQADLAQLQQVMTNLAVNARDAMPEGGTFHTHLATLRLRTEDQPPHPNLASGDWMVLSVSDTGTGISVENQKHVFEPFFTTKDIGQGSGLGLSQVYGIIKQHQGEILVHSEEGTGTTFVIYLPGIPAPDGAAPVMNKGELLRGQGQTILLVEDEVMVLKVTQRMLEKLDYKVLIARSGGEALTLYGQYQHQISLVLTDMTMPEMNGIVLAGKLLQRDASLKIIALSGYRGDEAHTRYQDQGFIGWLQKPVSLKQLAHTVQQALDIAV